MRRNSQAYPLTLIVNDRWRAQVPLERMGRYVYTVSAWKDDFASFVHEVRRNTPPEFPRGLSCRKVWCWWRRRRRDMTG